MKTFIFALALLTLPALVQAQSVVIDLGTGARTVTPTAVQIAKIARLRDIENARRAALTPPLAAITSEQWLQAILVSAVQSYVQQANELDAKDACTTYNAATTAVKNTVNTALGGKSPCL